MYYILDDEFWPPLAFQVRVLCRIFTYIPHSTKIPPEQSFGNDCFLPKILGQFGQKYLDNKVQIHKNGVRNVTNRFLVTLCYSYEPFDPLIL